MPLRLSAGRGEKILALVGFDRTYVSLLERGKRNPSLLTMSKIAKYLKIDASDLLENI